MGEPTISLLDMWKATAGTSVRSKTRDHRKRVWGTHYAYQFFFFLIISIFLLGKIPRLHGRFEILLFLYGKILRLYNYSANYCQNPHGSSRWAMSSRPKLITDSLSLFAINISSPRFGLIGLYFPVVSNGSTRLYSSRTLALLWNKPARFSARQQRNS